MTDKIGGEFKIRLVCGRCGKMSFWPVNVGTRPNMPTHCGRDLLFLGNSKVFIPYIPEDHPFLKRYLRSMENEIDGSSS